MTEQPPRAVLIAGSAFMGVAYAEHGLGWKQIGRHRYLNPAGEHVDVLSEHSDVIRALRGSGLREVYVTSSCSAAGLAKIRAYFPDMKIKRI